MIRLALFASGNGTNVEQIAEYFKNNPEVRIEIVIANKPDAFVRKRAARLGIEDIYFDKEDFYQTNKVLDCLIARRIDWIILAGFLWLVPQNLLNQYESRIINIHPALLPKYGGKGMYGHHVHQAVVANGERQTGITIHLVNEEYDKGKILFQASCNISKQDKVEDVANKIHALEKTRFPSVIASTIRRYSPLTSDLLAFAQRKTKKAPRHALKTPIKIKPYFLQNKVLTRKNRSFIKPKPSLNKVKSRKNRPH